MKEFCEMHEGETGGSLPLSQTCIVPSMLVMHPSGLRGTEFLTFCISLLLLPCISLKSKLCNLGQFFYF
jgi:hypothetical protein